MSFHGLVVPQFCTVVRIEEQADTSHHRKVDTDVVSPSHVLFGLENDQTLKGHSAKSLTSHYKPPVSTVLVSPSYRVVFLSYSSSDGGGTGAGD